MYEQKIQKFYEEISPFVYEQQHISQIILMSLFTGGSLLIEDLPGSGKTTLAKALAKLFGFDFARVHATSDLTPQDIVGGEFYDMDKKEIQIKLGPIFTELFLVDEINRMNPKTQSAFLQAMEEKSVSLSRKHFELGKYFRVIATQNPIELSGTFSLPEAQLDRFFAKISIGSPSKELQQKILLQNTALTINSKIENLSPIFEKHELDEIGEAIYQIHVDEKIAKRLVDFFENIKNHQNILYPLSQRGISLFLLAAKANAFIHQRTFLTPNDAYSVIPAVLIHRLNIEKNSHHIIQELFKDAFKNF